MSVVKHLIGGQWQGGAQSFRSAPYRGMGREYAAGTAADSDQAANAAESAFAEYAYTSVQTRAQLLNNIAAELQLQQGAIVSLCADETGLAAARIEAEFQRTIFQLHFFARHITQPEFLDSRHDPSLPDRSPLPRPEMHMVQRPVGPVAVFGASNFPLAFSTAGGDTVAALAAGCPVVVKAHSAHPGTADLVASAIHKAVIKTGVHRGVFSQIHSDNFEAGQALVQHPLIKAVGFTGSLGGGRHLFDLCAARPEPIPFYGELGSINPVFILPESLAANTADSAARWVASLTLGAGQLCTNPGLVVIQASPAAERFLQIAAEQVRQVSEQPMLSDSIAQSYRAGHDNIRDCSGTTALQLSYVSRRSATPAIFTISAAAWLENPFLADEVFGPLGQVLVTQSPAETLAIANSLAGQLTCSVHFTEAEAGSAKGLMTVLERKAGRVIANGFPTGVEVCDSMVHGGPYPASTNFGATSVGSLSIRRFLRPVCYQDVPDSLLPEGVSTTVGSGSISPSSSTQRVSQPATSTATSEPTPIADLSIEPSRTALILQDLQNDVMIDGGAFASTGSPQHAREQNVVANVKKLADACRARGVQVIHVWMVCEAGHPHLSQYAPLFQGLKGENALVRDTWGVQPAAGLEPQPNDLVVEKMSMSAWETSRLESYLRHAGIDTIINCGAWTNMSVEHTARTAADKGFRVIVPQDGCSTMNAEWHRASVDFAMGNVALVCDVHGVLQLLGR